MANGKSEEVERVYRKMAEMNGLEISNETIRIFKELNALQPENVRNVSLRSINDTFNINQLFSLISERIIRTEDKRKGTGQTSSSQFRHNDTFTRLLVLLVSKYIHLLRFIFEFGSICRRQIREFYTRCRRRNTSAFSYLAVD